MNLAWGLFGLYVVVTTYLGILGHKKTKGFSSFAIGDGKMSPWLVGITLAASTASAATFIINPGFVYVHGLSAFMHLGVSCFAGILFMLFLLSYRFRRIGKEIEAVTIPGWLGARYRSKKFAVFFSLINLLSFAFLVLLVGGTSIVLQSLLDISNVAAISFILIFVTLYVLIGGTYAHVFTNVLQGSLMIIVSLIIIGYGLNMMWHVEGFWAQISYADSHLITWTNPTSNLFSDFFSVYIAGFCIGAALVCQPHILTKSLYVATDKNVTKYLVIFGVVYMLFTCLLFAGFWAKLSLPVEMLDDPVTGSFRQDLVMTKFLEYNFPNWVFTIISVVLIAAAMSTLDGLLVGLSTITAHDLFLNVKKDDFTTQDDKYKAAYRASQLILLILAILTFWVTYSPPKLLGIYGQFGVYALVITSLTPILLGVLYENPPVSVAWIASIAALAIYMLLSNYGNMWFSESTLAFANPAVPAAIAIITTSIPSLLIGHLLKNSKYRK